MMTKTRVNLFNISPVSLRRAPSIAGLALVVAEMLLNKLPKVHEIR